MWKKSEVLDPACGSGSFLIKTFDFLNEYYQKNGKDYDQTDSTRNGIPFKTKSRIYRITSSGWI